MKVVKWIIICLFCLPFVLGISSCVFNNCTESGCNPVDYARITDVEYKAVVQDEPGGRGAIHITERLTFDIHAFSENNLFWELWRDLVEDEYDGIKIEYDVLSVKQILEDGTEIEYEESPVLYWEDEDYVNTNTRLGPGKWYHSPGPYDEDMRDYECVFFYVDGIYREEMVFEIEYVMYNAALRYKDCSDLYISMFSGDSVNDLESFKAEILIPDELMPSSECYTYTTYGTVNNDFEVDESDSVNPGYHTFMIDLDEEELKFTPYSEFIEFDLVTYGSDKHIFTQNASHNWYYNSPALDEILDEQYDYTQVPRRAKVAKTAIFIVLVATSGFVVFYAFYKKHKMMSKYFFFNPEVPYDQYREIPSELDPKFAAELVFCKHRKKSKDEDIYSALMLSLARKDFIELCDYGKDDIAIKIKKCPYKNAGQAVAAQNQFGQNSYGQSAYGQNTYSQNTYSQNTYNQYGYDQNGYNPNSYNQYGYNQPDYSYPNGQNPYYGVDSSLRGNVHTGIDLTYDSRFATSFDQNRSTPYTNSYNLNVNNVSFASSTKKDDDQYVKFDELTENETYYFNLLVRHAKDNFITMSEFRDCVAKDYANTDTFLSRLKASIPNIGTRRGYFQNATYKAPMEAMHGWAMLFGMIGWFFLIVVNLISRNYRLDYAFGAYTIFGVSCIFTAHYLLREGRKMILLTGFGESEYAKWRGLYNFLNSSTLINERTHIELPLWEQYLVYATAFGLSEKITKAIHISCPEYQSSTVLATNHVSSRRIRRSNRHFHSSARSGSSVARSGGGGFGYGGGGRGGGGGGGGH